MHINIAHGAWQWCGEGGAAALGGGGQRGEAGDICNDANNNKRKSCFDKSNCREWQLKSHLLRIHKIRTSGISEYRALKILFSPKAIIKKKKSWSQNQLFQGSEKGQRNITIWELFIQEKLNFYTCNRLCGGLPWGGCPPPETCGGTSWENGLFCCWGGQLDLKKTEEKLHTLEWCQKQ